MRQIKWIIAWSGVALWSLFAWGSYAFVDAFTNWASGSADQFSTNPETVEWISSLLISLRHLGLSAVIVVWALVALVILAVPFFWGRLTKRPSSYQKPPFAKIT